jgi:hypothetical protein
MSEREKLAFGRYARHSKSEGTDRETDASRYAGGCMHACVHGNIDWRATSTLPARLLACSNLQLRPCHHLVNGKAPRARELLSIESIVYAGLEGLVALPGAGVECYLLSCRHTWCFALVQRRGQRLS